MAFPVVNLRPRILPTAVPTDLSAGVQGAADQLLGLFEQRRQEGREEEASALGFEREKELTGIEQAGRYSHN